MDNKFWYGLKSESLAILEGAAIRYSMHFRFHTHYLTYRENVFVDSQEVHLLIPAHFDFSRLMSVCKHMMAKSWTSSLKGWMTYKPLRVSLKTMM